MDEEEDTSSSDWECDPDLEAMMRALPVVELGPCILEPGPARDEEENFADEIFWNVIFGVSLRDWETTRLTESNRIVLEPAQKNAAKYIKDMVDYVKKIDEVNATLSKKEKFDCYAIWPRSPSPSCFYGWYRIYRMSNTNPTSVRSKRYTEPGACEYDGSEILQFFSLKFAGDFLNCKTMSIYGFVAVRDHVEPLRNYVFQRSRRNAHEIYPNSTTIPLISPARGISTYFDALIEYSIKVKKNDSDCAEEDLELIDGCFTFNHDNVRCSLLRDVRIYGPVGPVDIRFVSLMNAVEASIDVKIKRAAKGFHLKAVTAYTSDYPHGVMMYEYDHSPASSLVVSEDDGSSLVAVVDSWVVAVQRGYDLKLKFDVCIKDDDPECEFNEDTDIRGVKTHELSFAFQKYRSSEGSVVIGGLFELEAKVTWSTMGIKRFRFPFP